MRQEPLEGNTAETPRFGEVSTKQQRIAKLARQHPEQALTNLHHYIDENWLRVAFEWTRTDGAAGIDGQTAEEYERDLAGNLQRLLGEIKSGRYVARLPWRSAQKNNTSPIWLCHPPISTRSL